MATNRQRAGRLAKKAGEAFEQYFEAVCRRSQVTCVRIPDGCRSYKDRFGKLNLRRVKTPFDYMITKDGWTACIDCKTVDANTFSHSSIDPDQLRSLVETGKSVPSGYLVWFRKSDKVTFFNHKKLYEINRGESLKPEDGHFLGDIRTFNPVEILNGWTKPKRYQANMP